MSIDDIKAIPDNLLGWMPLAWGVHEADEWHAMSNTIDDGESIDELGV